MLILNSLHIYIYFFSRLTVRQWSWSFDEKIGKWRVPLEQTPLLLFLVFCMERCRVWQPFKACGLLAELFWVWERLVILCPNVSTLLSIRRVQQMISLNQSPGFPQETVCSGWRLGFTLNSIVAEPGACSSLRECIFTQASQQCFWQQAEQPPRPAGRAGRTFT